MRKKISRTAYGIALPALLWLTATQAMAQECQVLVSRPEIQLGSQPPAVDGKAQFAQQMLTVTATCSGEGAVSLLVDGTPDESGKYFRFGERGRMALKLLSAQYNGADTALTVISAERGERQFRPGQAERLSAGNQLTVRKATGDDSSSQQLTLQMQLDFPASNNEGRMRDRMEMSGQLRFEAVQTAPPP